MNRTILCCLLCLLAFVSLAAHAQFSISAPQGYVSAGNTLTLKATASGAGPLPAGLQWRSGNEDILKSTAVVGQYQGIKAGPPVNVTLTDPATGSFNSISIIVTPGDPLNFTITGLPSTLAIGASTLLAANANYTIAGKVTAMPLTTGTVWTVTPMPAGSATFDPSTGILKAVAAGTVHISAVNATFSPAFGPVVADLSIPSIPTPNTPRFSESPKSGNSYVSVNGTKGDVITLFQINTSDPTTDGVACNFGPGDKTILQTISTGTTATNSLSLPATGTNRIALSQPLIPGVGLCLMAGDDPNPSNNAQSTLLNVQDSADFGRVRTFTTIGVQISNQLPASASGTGTSTSSSSAAEYLEVGFTSAVRRAPVPSRQSPRSYLLPGVQTVFDVRLSPIPVSATTTNTSTTTNTINGAAPTTATTTSLASLNVLSSQQSARVQAQVYFPSRLTSWQNGYDVFTVAPLAKAGFTTLLNPSTTSSNAGMVTTASYSPTYSFFAFGGRLAWDQYARDPDKSPHMVTQMDISLAKFSSLPSYLCVSDPTKLNPYLPLDVNGNPPAKPVFTTACGQGTLANLKYISRTLAYRLDINAIAKLPNYPFVLGINANLAQYTVGHNAVIDYFNKAGNDIRIFIGITIPLSSLGSLITTGTTGK